MSKYVTLVFEWKYNKYFDDISKMAHKESCLAWSTTHEIARLELIEKALNENDIKKAKIYIEAEDITRFLDDLKH